MKSKDQKEQGTQPGVPEKNRDDKRDGDAPLKVAQQRSVLALPYVVIL